MSQLKQFDSVNTQQSFVGRDHIFAGSQQFLHHRLGVGAAAHQLQDDCDVGVVDDTVDIAGQHFRRNRDIAFLIDVQYANFGQFDRSTRAASDAVLFVQQKTGDATSNGSQTNHSDFDGIRTH